MENPNDIILVNETDEVTGYGEKMEVHRKGLLHRAFSVLVFNDKGETLLQRRAFEKYHSPGLWTNTCCSHPMPHETTGEAALRRLQEEMGFTCKVEHIGKFHYTAEFDNGLTENEMDHVFTGFYNAVPVPNPAEVCEIRWISIPDLILWMQTNPDEFTVWFRIIAENVFVDGKMVSKI